MVERSSDQYPPGAVTTIAELEGLIFKAHGGAQVVLFTVRLEPIRVASTSFIGVDPLGELVIDKAVLGSSTFLKCVHPSKYLDLHFGGSHYWSLYTNAPVLPWPAFDGSEGFIFTNWMLAWAEKLRRATRCKST